jgi:hypothetical protein
MLFCTDALKHPRQVDFEQFDLIAFEALFEMRLVEGLSR